jgi:hypothetical protein
MASAQTQTHILVESVRRAVKVCVLMLESPRFVTPCPQPAGCENR